MSKKKLRTGITSYLWLPESQRFTERKRRAWRPNPARRWNQSQGFLEKVSRFRLLQHGFPHRVSFRRAFGTPELMRIEVKQAPAGLSPGGGLFHTVTIAGESRK